MADEKSKNSQKTATRTPRKRASSQSTTQTASGESPNVNVDTRNDETPVLAIEQSSEVGRHGSDDVDEIRRQAYALYLSRGGGDGNDLSDWLEAERIVRLRRDGAGASADRSHR